MIKAIMVVMVMVVCVVAGEVHGSAGVDSKYMIWGNEFSNGASLQGSAGYTEGVVDTTVYTHTVEVAGVSGYEVTPIVGVNVGNEVASCGVGYVIDRFTSSHELDADYMQLLGSVKVGKLLVISPFYFYDTTHGREKMKSITASLAEDGVSGSVEYGVVTGGNEYTNVKVGNKLVYMMIVHSYGHNTVIAGIAKGF